MDDVRVWLRAIMLGCKWMNGQLLFRKSWKLEDEEKRITHLAKTTEVLEGM